MIIKGPTQRLTNDATAVKQTPGAYYLDVVGGRRILPDRLTLAAQWREMLKPVELGLSVSVDWAQLEPSPGQIDLGALEPAIDWHAATGGPWMLTVVACGGDATPAWLDTYRLPNGVAVPWESKEVWIFGYNHDGTEVYVKLRLNPTRRNEMPRGAVWSFHKATHPLRYPLRGGA